MNEENISLITVSHYFFYFFFLNTHSISFWSWTIVVFRYRQWGIFILFFFVFSKDNALDRYIFLLKTVFINFVLLITLCLLLFLNILLTLTWSYFSSSYLSILLRLAYRTIQKFLHSPRPAWQLCDIQVDDSGEFQELRIKQPACSYGGKSVLGLSTAYILSLIHI